MALQPYDGSYYHVAWLYFLRGRFDHALKQFQWVETEAINYGDATQAALCRLDLAEVYLQLNAFEDALESVRQMGGQVVRTPY